MQNIPKKITLAELYEIINSTTEYKLFDVREENEYITGHAPTAELFPIDEINEKSAVERIPSKETMVLTYCRSGSRSKEAAQYLLSIGYKNVYDIGSLVGWQYGYEYGI